MFAVEIDSAHNNPYPLCLFQYVALQNTSAILPSHYTIIISNSLLSNYKLLSYRSVNGYLQRCFMVTSLKQLINRSYNLIITLHSTILHFSNFNTGHDMLGPVHPGQLLHVEFCMPC